MKYYEIFIFAHTKTPARHHKIQQPGPTWRRKLSWRNLWNFGNLWNSRNISSVRKTRFFCMISGWSSLRVWQGGRPCILLFQKGKKFTNFLFTRSPHIHAFCPLLCYLCCLYICFCRNDTQIFPFLRAFRFLWFFCESFVRGFWSPI